MTFYQKNASTFFHCYKCCLWTCQTWYRKRATGRNRVLLLASRASSSSFLFPSSPCHSIFFSKTIPKSPNKTLETNTIFPVKITLCTLHYFRREDDVSHTLRHFMGTKILLTRRDQTEINQIEWETIANVFLQLKQFHSGWNNSKWAHFVFLKRAFDFSLRFFVSLAYWPEYRARARAICACAETK